MIANVGEYKKNRYKNGERLVGKHHDVEIEINELDTDAFLEHIRRNEKGRP